MTPFVIVTPFMFDGKVCTAGNETALMQNPDWGDIHLAGQIKAGNVKPAYAGENWYSGPEAEKLHCNGMVMASQVYTSLFIDKTKYAGITVAKTKAIAKYLETQGYFIPKSAPVQKAETAGKTRK